MKIINKLKLHKKLILIHLLPLAVFCLVGAVLAVKLGQDQNWDLLNYHYNNAHALLHHQESANFGSSGIETYINPLLDVIPYLLITHFKPILAGAMLGALQGLNMWLIYEISILVMSRFIKDKKLYALSGVIALASFLGAGNVSEVGGTMGDNLSSILVLLSLLLILITLRKRETLKPRQSMYIKIAAYIILGFAVGTKLTNTPFAIGILALEFMNFSNLKSLIKSGLIAGVSILAGLFLGTGIWSYYLLKTYKNPVFPFYNGIFHSPYYPSRNFVDVRWFQHDLLHRLFYPFYFIRSQNLAAEPIFRDSRLAMLYVAIVLFAGFLLLRLASKKLSKIKIPKEVYTLVLFTVVSYVIWEKQFSYFRYIMVLEFLAILVIVAIIWTLLPKQKLAWALSLVCIVFLVAATKPMNWGRVHWQPNYFGVQIPANFLDKNSTVLLAGGQPLSFLITSFPRDVPFIRIDSDLSTAGVGNTIAQKLLRSRVAAEQNQGDTFYGIQTVPNEKQEIQAFKIYGFGVGECRPLVTYVSQYLVSDLNYFRLCRLNKL